MINCFIGVGRFYFHANQLRSIIRYRRYSPALARMSSLQVSIFFFFLLRAFDFFTLDRVLLAVAGRTSVALKSPSSAIEDGGMLFRGRPLRRDGDTWSDHVSRGTVYIPFAPVYIFCLPGNI